MYAIKELPLIEQIGRAKNEQAISLTRQPAPSFHFPLKKIHNLLIKRTFDILLSVVLIIGILSWLFPLLAILIKLDSGGPVFFLQKRNRHAGKLFTCIKFRTMVINDEADVLAAIVNDKRVTRIGKFLRLYHLDELPQLFNVLLGDMSMIGPRPNMVHENLYYESMLDAYDQRHAIKPGITGLAQSYGYFGSHHEIDHVKKRIDLDICYIQQWTLLIDIQILFRTVLMLLRIGTVAPEMNQQMIIKTRRS